MTLSIRRLAASVAAVALWAAPAAAMAQDPAGGAAPDESRLFAVEITVGPQWDASRPAHEQRYFPEHSATLKRLRDSGVLVIGARYSDKGLVVLAADDETHVRAMMDEDPSIKAEVFQYQVHPFNVFYGGTVNSPARRTGQ